MSLWKRGQKTGSAFLGEAGTDPILKLKMMLMRHKSDGGKSVAGRASNTNREILLVQSVLSTASREARAFSDLCVQIESRRNDTSWLSDDAS